MPESNNGVVRRVDVAPSVPPIDRIKLLLAARGHASVAAWARTRGHGESMVWHALTGRRSNAKTEAILNDLAEDVGRPRATIDALIAGADPAEESAEVADRGAA